MDREDIIKGLYEISRIVTSKLGFEQAKKHLDTIACAVVLLKEQDSEKKCCRDCEYYGDCHDE